MTLPPPRTSARSPFLRWSALPLVLLALGCGEEQPHRAAVGPDPGNATFHVRESLEQLHVWGAPPGTAITLEGADGEVVQSGTTGERGTYMFRLVTPGTGYVIRVGDEHTAALTVHPLDGLQPEQEFYASQQLHPGLNYITTRDGTRLSAYVTLPGPEADGPYPTVVNYSGYDPSKPGAPMEGLEGMCGTFPSLCDPPSDPSGLIASLMGYATVGVNIRGTGCSGGAYDYWETQQLTDGYDAIETVAAQDWVLNHRVGMTGLSYPGIAQLFVASTRPPSLAAITPLSVIGDTATTLRPGGILNDGFAIQWGSSVLEKAAPFGQGWEQARVDAGDTVCGENQDLHEQAVDIIQKARDTRYYDPAIIDPINPTRLVGNIDVPVFLASAWQDEQTGPFFTTLLDQFTGAPLRRFTVYNGVHVDGFAPQVMGEWKNFLDLYVARRVPSVDPRLITLGAFLFNQIFGTSVSLEESRFAGQPDHAAALAAFEAEPELRVIFESGAGGQRPGAPVGTFEEHFSGWPITATQARRFHLQPDGSLGDAAPTATASASRFDLDPEAGQRGNLAPGGDVWDPLPDYAWTQEPEGSMASFVSAPLTEDLVMVGTGSVDLWLRSTVNDADLEVTLTEVRPDGQEMYIQSGWLRASLRATLDTSTELFPVHRMQQQDDQPLVPGEWVEARVLLASFAHVFRTGSRVRLVIDTPGDTRAAWRFELAPFPGGASYDIGHDAAHASSLALPVIAGVTATSPLPPCPSLRGQPCRVYTPVVNTASP